jgi:transcriptional regulator EpsA
MSGLVLLDRQEEEHLVRVLEAGINVTDSRQLYMWAQGPLQGLIPHKALVCMQVSQSQVIRLDAYHSPHLPQQVMDELTSSQDSSILQLLKTSAAHGIRPQWLEFEGFSDDAEAQRHIQRLLRLGLSNALLCGSYVDSGVNTVFILLEVQPTKTIERTSYLLELLLAQLHLSYIRISAQQGRNGLSEKMAAPVSSRELDIMRLVAKGKSNQEIAELLFISPFTVKNHVHNILKKLKVSNRMQAANKIQSLLLA